MRIFILFLSCFFFFVHPAFAAKDCNSFFDSESSKEGAKRERLEIIKDKSLHFELRKKAFFDYVEFLAKTEDKLDPSHIYKHMNNAFTKKQKNRIMDEMHVWETEGSTSQKLVKMRLEEAQFFTEGNFSVITNIQSVIKEYGIDFLIRKKDFFNLLYHGYSNPNDIIFSMLSFSKKEQTHIVAEIKSEKKARLEIKDLLSAEIFNMDFEMRKEILNSQWAVFVDLNAVNNSSRTPLLHSLNLKEEKTALLFIEKGADVTMADKYGDTALHIAAKYGLIKIAKLLIKKGADVNFRNKANYTPLMYIVMNDIELENKIKMVKLLLQQGADVTIRHYGGRTAKDMALEIERAEYEEGHDRVTSILEKAERGH